MDTQAAKPANPKILSQNRKLASQAVIRPHAILRKLASLPDTVPGQPRGMALIDTLDERIATAELEDSQDDQRNAAQLKLAEVTERIAQRTTAVPGYSQCIDEIAPVTNQLTNAVEQYGISESENVPFYRLLKEEILRKV